MKGVWKGFFQKQALNLYEKIVTLEIFYKEMVWYFSILDETLKHYYNSSLVLNSYDSMFENNFSKGINKTQILNWTASQAVL